MSFTPSQTRLMRALAAANAAFNAYESPKNLCALTNAAAVCAPFALIREDLLLDDWADAAGVGNVETLRELENLVDRRAMQRPLALLVRARVCVWEHDLRERHHLDRRVERVVFGAEVSGDMREEIAGELSAGEMAAAVAKGARDVASYAPKLVSRTATARAAAGGSVSQRSMARYRRSLPLIAASCLSSAALSTSTSGMFE
jgi:hypothetical protein